MTVTKSGAITRVIIIVVVGAALAGGAWFYVQNQNQNSRQEAIDDIKRVMNDLDGYRNFPEYYDKLLEECAAKANGSGVAYEKEILALMVERLKADGKEGHTRLNALARSLDN